ncbi:MAG TPA: hypothetical protein VMA54_17865 [Steroidobacteraceae bacterium]|nr:hypothetical protein [Steroidobacteraceae bacterium]
MTSASARSSEHRGEAGTGPFMLTLCRLAEPVTIRPPQAPHLKPFKFFTSRALQRDGSEQLYLHMGFFETLAHAQKWARAVRGRHPGAIATAAPPAFLQRFDPVDNQSLTDTQVLNILETRQPAPARDDADPGSERIELIRPDDTGTRLALKEAVVRGMPVSFALQLQWSARPIDLSRVPPLPIFEAYSLYVVESRSGGRSCFFLRLGFFGDPVSAKQVAAHLRSSFASAAVVPVLDEEISCAREACMGTSLIPCLLRERLDHLEPESTHTPEPSRGSESARRRETSEKSSGSLEQTLAQLAEREMWSDPDFLSDTGVRHLKVEVQKLTSGGRH